MKNQTSPFVLTNEKNAQENLLAEQQFFPKIRNQTSLNDRLVACTVRLRYNCNQPHDTFISIY